MEIRSFLAFELPLDIKRIVARVSGEFRESTLNVRWVQADNIHLTVVFMGNIKSEEIKAIGDVSQKVCLKYAPFDILLSGMGSFPNKRNPKIIWLGLSADLERMSHFRNALQKGLKPFGIKEEKRGFRPHLTLGRFRKFNRADSQWDEFILRYKDLESPVRPLNELVLFKSDLKPGGAVYTKLESWPLSGEK